MKSSLICIVLIAALTLGGCDPAADSEATLTLATTTSTRDSGLLDELIPRFESETGLSVKVVAVGSGQALELGRRGDADVLLTHAPFAEQQFMDDGFGLERIPVMHNDFVLVGPLEARLAKDAQMNIEAAFQQVVEDRLPFVSRGDESGTHMKERSIWRQIGCTPKGDWYIESGAGMAQALRMASEKQAFTLADRGTFLSQRKRLELKIACEGDPVLQNPYTVIVINNDRHPNVNVSGARLFADFLVAPETRQAIKSFGVDQYGQPLFFPN